MASLKFPDTGTRRVEYDNGRPAVNARAYLYADDDLTVPAEAYRDVNGVKGALLATDEDDRRYMRLDAYGRIVDFWGPVDGTDRLWIVVNGVKSVVDADYNARLDALSAGVTGALLKSANLGDLNDLDAARTNLELGDAALRNVGAGSGTVAAGNDSRITGAAQKEANLGDLNSATAGRSNLGLGNSAVRNVGTTSGDVAAGDAPAAAQAAAVAAIASHEADQTNVHGITDTSVLETQSGAQAKATAAQTAAADDATDKVAAHQADTTNVHGITDTAALETTTGSQAKADSAQTAATDAAAADATSKVSAEAALRVTGDAASVATAAGDATSKANAVQAAAVQRANHTGTQTSATISDFAEAAQDAIAALIGAGPNITVTYDDNANALVITGADGVTDPEVVRDAIGAALVGVGPLNITVNDGADTITITNTATVNSTDAALRDRSTHTGTQTVGTITGLGDAATKNTGTSSTTLAAGDAPAAAQAAAISAAATDATTKANAAQAAAVQRVNHTGTQSADTLTDGTTNKAFLATERAKLAGVATGATANVDATTGVKGVVQLAGDLGGTATSPTVPGLVDKVSKGDLFIDPRDAPYNADPTGVTDATAAVVAAFTAANAAARVGLSASILHPGATVVLRGKFNLATLSTPIEARCNVDSHGAEFIVPDAYAGVAILAGHSGNGSILQAAKLTLPDVVKSTGAAIVAGSVGVRLQNLWNSKVQIGRVVYQETGLHLTGWNNGTVYNHIFMGWISYCKVSVLLKPHLTGGWANQNEFASGGIQQSEGYSGGRKVAGYRHIVLDYNGINTITGNTFYGVSLEGDVSEYVIELKGAYDNVWHGCRHEQGVAGTICTVSSATITKTAHGLSVGDMVTFSASAAPTGMYLIVPYYVSTVPTADTFTVASNRGGSAITFGSTGTSVVYFRPQRILIDTTAFTSYNNTFQLPMTPLNVVDLVITGSQSTNNIIEYPARKTLDAFIPEDAPLWRARNRSSTGASRPIWAAYPATYDPNHDPYAWTTALGERGLLFQDAGGRTETGRLFNAAGVMSYKRPADATSYEIASCRRSPSTISVSALSCAANTTTSTTFTLTGANTSEHVLVTPLAVMTAGIFLSHAYISAADTVTVVFGNLTASPVSLTVSLQAIAFRRYY